jgi:acyl dehydratase
MNSTRAVPRQGAELPVLELPALSTADLARYAAASGDQAAVHLDEAYARAMGFPGVIAHGLLVMAYLGRAVTAWQPLRALQSFSCRFVAVTLPGERLRCCGTVAAVHADAGGPLAELQLEMRNERGELKLSGRAVVRLARPAAAD